MRSILTAASAALLVFALAACSAPTRPEAPPADTPLLLISIDGFRASYFELGQTPNLERLAGDGVRAQWMTPSYPSLTFPNHYTLVTGLRPDHHGVIHNSMSDAAIGKFKVADRDAVGDTRWWSGGEPIWIGAQKAGLRSATLFWPGSEAPIHGLRPNRWRPFDAKVDENARVDEVLGWLGEPASTRPHVATLYFDALDHEGHDHGPNSPEAREAMVRIDAAIGRLLDGLAARDQLEHVNLIVVSDHGMAEVVPGHRIAVEDMVTPEQAVVTSVGQSIGIAPNPGFEAQVERRLLGAHAQYDCWRKSELPARWHYGTHPRVPPIVCQMHEGWDAIEGEKLRGATQVQTRGSHGFDPALPSMRAIFLARGPAFKRGASIPAFDNVDVYPLLARLIGIRPAKNDGDIAPLLPALRDPGRP
ncbi:ectonucleotide pyrophosphatase/phosphodiesterase [Lysobacter capsici]|uniref:alkaline phosphatase family protein n=1 Tax=Lysobacter capsici TaxID=435897 RepID=UPI001781A47E|nr:ectonucleotide pyrophosphatase/phosphodiesterase [Lysobacter capsici]UOF13548.1 ectonucleotide pyrophosphatase/phosphodiesterase [Lysobacter capsici]